MCLEVNKKYSMRELCEVLSLKYSSSGNSLRSNLKEIERYCSYRKEGRGYIIDEVYPAPLDKLDKRNGNSPYTTPIEMRLLELLNQAEGYQLNVSLTYLLDRLGFVNTRYMISSRKDVFEELKRQGVTKDYLHSFVSETNSIYKRIIDRNLRLLADKYLISFTKKTMFARKGNIFVRDKNGNLVENADGTFKTYRGVIREEATPDELKTLLYARRLALEKLGCKDKQDVIKKGLWADFIKITKVYADMYGLEYDYTYEGYELILNQEAIQQEINQAALKEINALSVERLEKSKNKVLNTDRKSKSILIDNLIKIA